VTAARRTLLLGAIGAAALGSWLLWTGAGGRREGAPPPVRGGPDAPSGAHPLHGETAAAPRASSSPASPASPERPPDAAAAPTPAQQGDAALSRALSLRHPEKSPLLDELARYSADELGLRARAGRAVRGPPPDAVEQLIRLRRGGAGREQLLALADRDLGTPLGLRVAVLEWIDQVAPP
jgi:pyruvate/2-oxoglutarate dehydrogenase complex dihydrolipoamide acyltransferase (E2) component